MANYQNFNVLISSASKKIPLINAVKSAIAKFDLDIKIHAADNNINAISRYFVDEFWNIPLLNQLSPDDILNYCIKNNIKAIIPTRDGELEFFATNKEYFENKNIKIMISSLDTIKICNDKLRFYEFLYEKGLPVITTSTQINKISASKYVVKERYGSGARKIAINIAYEQAINFASNLENPIFQPFIEGEEISVDFYVDKKNNLKGVISRVRDYIVNGESQITHTIRDDFIVDLCFKLTRVLSFYGHNMIQLIKDKKNNYHILECNCRFGGASTLSVFAGLDSFYWFLLETLGSDLDNYPFVSSLNNLKMVRFPSDKIIHGNCF